MTWNMGIPFQRLDGVLCTIVAPFLASLPHKIPPQPNCAVAGGMKLPWTPIKSTLYDCTTAKEH